MTQKNTSVLCVLSFVRDRVTTEIRFSIPTRDHISVTVYDGLGRKIAQLMAEELLDRGRYALEFNGSGLPAGTYIVELRAGQESIVEKMLIRK